MRQQSPIIMRRSHGTGLSNLKQGDGKAFESEGQGTHQEVGGDLSLCMHQSREAGGGGGVQR